MEIIDSKIKAVLFDFDGTIMDTNQIIINSWQHTFRELLGEEQPLSRILNTFGEPLEISMKKEFPDIPVEKSVNIYRDYHRERFVDSIEIFPGIQDLIEKLGGLGYKLAVVTSRLPGSTMQGLEKYGLERWFDEVITCNDTIKHKPDPEPVQLALDRLEVSAAEAVLIGDSIFDISSAKGAGVKSILVGWTAAEKHQKIHGINDPDYQIDEVDDVFGILEELGGIVE